MDQSTDSAKNWATKVVALYAEGCSDAEVAADLRVTIRDYYKRIEESSAFKQLVEFGRTLSQAHWEGLARKNVGNKSFNGPLYAFYMKNKFGWADKTEVTSMGDNPQQDLDTLKQHLSKEVAKFIEKQTPELTDAKRVLELVNTNDR